MNIKNIFIPLVAGAVLIATYVYATRADAIFWVTLAALAAVILYCDFKFNMLRDESTAAHKPYSFARVQLAWWTVIVLTSIVSIVVTRNTFPVLWDSTLILLGISTATTAAARVIDTSDESNPDVVRHQNTDEKGKSNMLLDILSDENGVSIHRFQTVIFNLVFGAWFVVTVVRHLPHETNVNFIMPSIDTNNLILLGLSSATYAGLKATENKKSKQSAQPETVQDEATNEAAG